MGSDLFRSLSEPFCVDSISHMFQRGQISLENVRQLMRSTVSQVIIIVISKED